MVGKGGGGPQGRALGADVVLVGLVAKVQNDAPVLRERLQRRCDLGLARSAAARRMSRWALVSSGAECAGRGSRAVVRRGLVHLQGMPLLQAGHKRTTDADTGSGGSRAWAGERTRSASGTRGAQLCRCERSWA